ncbi:DNA mismatch repair protein MutS [Candidatus Babeliales bacterium]|nr:DNA mismatch repair protein MutS [Candidatus Babeliales bacterium]
MVNHTPLMRQYFAIREQHSDAILLFQVGDFYELFFDDAIKASSFLGIALTKRGKANGKDIPLCGVPIHAINHYLTKLIRGGFKVALCDQMTKPQPGKVVERAVTQVFTPGTLTDSHLLDEKSPSYLLSFYPGKKQCGMVFTELLTAQLFATAIPFDSYRMLEAELARFSPDEILVPFGGGDSFASKFRQQGYVVSNVGEEPSPLRGDPSIQSFHAAHSKITQDERLKSSVRLECPAKFEERSMGVSRDTDGQDIVGPDVPALWIEKQFDRAILSRLSESHSMTNSLYLLYWYLKKNQQRALEQFKTINFYQPDDYLVLDAATQKNLEIVKNLHDGGRKNSLFFVVDKAITSMGSRTIKKWLQRPLVKKSVILQRQEMVAAIAKNIEAMQKLQELFGQLSDLERIVGRVALCRALLNDYLALKSSLKLVPDIKQVLEQYFLFQLSSAIQDKIRDFSPLVELLEVALDDDSLTKSIIKNGFDQELDRLRGLVENSQQAVLTLEQREIERTRISSLKIRYNNIAGYFIEVTKPNIKLVPENYIQQQTLVNRNRYVTQELKDLERDILRARNEINEVEKNAFERVKKEVERELTGLRSLAQALSYLDALLGFARVAYDNNYVAPIFHESRDIIIEQGRHPVVEIVFGSQFIPNNTNLTDQESIWILTGPNMGGKSTYLRQVALLCLMAQAGSLVPASAARLPILDRIFTRIGSGDNLAQGKSTFLVEMEETAAICSQATKNSLVILDEVGRGTSTFDGMAIAQAILEYLATQVQPRCLFATHYHELTLLKEHFSNIENYHMAIEKGKEGVLFLYKVICGVSEGSFGIEVAKLAGLPRTVVARAQEILLTLDQLEHQKDRAVFKPASVTGDASEVARLKSELASKNKQLSELESVSLDDLSPRQAFDLLWKIKEKG